MPGKECLNPSVSDGQKQGLEQQERDCKFVCKLLCCKCSFCHQVATKERHNPIYCHNYTDQFSQSRKYMRFYAQGRSYQFKALPFGLSTAPMDFTVVAKEVKLMALQKGIRIHQYIDDWLVRATSHQTCLQHTQTLVALCGELGWLVNKEKSELDPKQVFSFIGYQFDLKEGKVRPTLERLAVLDRQNSDNSVRSGVSGLAVHVPHRASDSHRNASPPR